MLKALGYYVAIVVVVFGLLLGIPAAVAAFLVYGSWGRAGVFWCTHTLMSAMSMVGIIPIYGNKLHFMLAQSLLFPWAAANGVGASWLLSLSGLLASSFGAMCPGAFVWPMLDKKGRGVPGIFLILGVAVYIVGSIYGGLLFFNRV